VNSARPIADASSRAVEALLAATPVLVGVASRAMEALDEEVSLTQFRLLRALAELGATPSAVVAERLGSAASSITRLADRLEDSGHLVRRRERPNRSVVRLELTTSGRDLVARVEEGRRRELTALVDRLPSAAVPDVAGALEALTDAAGADYDQAGPIELQAL
jgi:DNA-binding MarR family transcriptional regulator